MASQSKDPPRSRFHGRVADTGERCAEPGCDGAGEFRAPSRDGFGVGGGGAGARYRWLCLDHVRAFNARYNFFDGMSVDEIHHAQRPLAGWESETRAFTGTGGADRPPRWADFADPLDAIGARFRGRTEAAGVRADGKVLTAGDRRALSVLGLGLDADLRAVRRRYSDLVRRFHPDRNGGDRAQETKLREVIEAWQVLRKSPAFG